MYAVVQPLQKLNLNSLPNIHSATMHTHTHIPTKLSQYSYAFMFNTFHPLFALVLFSLLCCVCCCFHFFFHSCCFSQSCHLLLLFTLFSYFSFFISLLQFREVTFIKYTFRMLRRTMLDSLLFTIGICYVISNRNESENGSSTQQQKQQQQQRQGEREREEKKNN